MDIHDGNRFLVQLSSSFTSSFPALNRGASRIGGLFICASISDCTFAVTQLLRGSDTFLFRID